MSTMIIHGANTLIPFERVVEVFESARELPGFSPNLIMAEGGTGLNVRFDETVPKPPAADSMAIEKVYFYGEIKHQPEEAALLRRQLEEFRANPEACGFRAIQGVYVQRRASASGSAVGKIKFSFPSPDSPMWVSASGRNVTFEDLGCLVEALLAPAIPVELIVPGDRPMEIRVGAVTSTLNAASGSVSVTLPDGVDFTVEEFCSAIKGVGFSISGWCWNVWASGFPSPGEIHRAWSVLSDKLTVRSKGQIDMEYRLLGIEGLELIRAAATPRKSYSTELGQFKWDKRELAQLAMRAFPDGYRLEIHCKCDNDAFLQELGTRFGVRFGKVISR